MRNQRIYKPAKKNMRTPFDVHWCMGCGMVAVPNPRQFHSSQCYERWKRENSDMDTGDAGPEGEKTAPYDIVGDTFVPQRRG